MNATSCPAREVLAAYVRGTLAEDAAKAIDDHLPGCAQCNALLAALEGPDEVVDALREAPAPDGFAAEPEYHRALAELREHYAGASGAEATQPLPSLPETPSTPFTPGGRLLGRYEVRREVGRGGMGVVYSAWDRELSREVAVKVPALEHLPAGFVETFLQEARTAAALEHPGIIRIYDFGRHEGVAFAVMQYVDGPSLKETIASQPVSHARAVEILIDIAEALHYAHKRGFIHRDLKPGNILFDREGKPHIADFGLAIHESQQESLAGSTSGTAAYMAPEQARGETQWLDGRADLWALGVILYEMLARRRPFQAATASEIREEILHREPKPLRMIDDSIPAALEAICLKCLSKDVKDRFSSARDLVRVLRRCLARPSADAEGPHPFFQRWYHQFSARLSFGRLGCAFVVTVASLLVCVTAFLFTLRTTREVTLEQQPDSKADKGAGVLEKRMTGNEAPPDPRVMLLSDYIEAQAKRVAAQGDFLDSVAIARKIHAEAYALEIQNSVEEVKARFERRGNRAALLEEKGFRPDIIREKKRKAAEAYFGKDIRDLLNQPDLSKPLNWLLAELCGPTMAVQYQAGSEVLPDLNERLSEEAKAQIWLTDGGSAGSRVDFRLSDGKVPDTPWPPGLRRERFDPHRTEFEAARDELVKEIEANGRVSDKTRDRLILAANQLLVTLEEVFQDRQEPSVFLEYSASKRYLQFLVSQVNRAISINDRSVFTASLRFQGGTVLDLLRYMYQSGLVFAPPKEGGEGTYRSLVQSLRNLYINLSPGRPDGTGDQAEKK